MGTLLNRRRYMGGKGVKYLEFECPRMWELIAYHFGDVVDMRGKEIASGELEGDGDTQVKSDVAFARGLAIGAHKDSDGNNIAAKAARTVDYRIEIEVTSGAGSNVPWELDNTTMSTADTPIFQILEETGFNSSSTKPAATTFANVLSDGSTGWGSQSVLVRGGNKWYADFTSTVNTNYLQVAIRAAAGVTIKWRIIPKTTSANACWQPVGITKTQCEAVTTFGSNNYAIQIFRGNSHITKFNEFEYFTSITTLWGNHTAGRCGGFINCSNLTSVKLPTSLVTLGQNVFAGLNSLSELDFKNIKTIDYRTFYAGIIKSYVFNDGFTSVNGGASMVSQPSYIDFPSTTASIANASWNSSGSWTYPVVVCRALTPPTLGTNNMSHTKRVYVPQASLENYKTASNWSAAATKMLPIEGSWYETHRSLDPNEP